MDTKSYINEDFETLLVQKSFEQLLPEEKSFVLQHLQSGEEYNQLRQLYLQVIDLGQDDEDLTPDPRVKKSLDALFEEQKITSIPLYKRRVFWSSISGIAAIFIIAFLWLNIEHNTEPPLLAENNVLEKAKPKTEPNVPTTPKDTEEYKAPTIHQIESVSDETIDAAISSCDGDVSLPPPTEVYEKTAEAIETDNDLVVNANAPARAESSALDGVTTIMEVEARYRAGNDQLIQDLHNIALQSLSKSTPESKAKTKEAALAKKEADLKEDAPKTLKSGKYFFHLSIDEKGNLKSVNILKSPNPGSTFDQELLSNLKKQLGKFEAIERNGKKVSSSINVPVQIHFE